MSLIFNPVWKPECGGPLVCAKELRPAFATATAARAYHDKNAPRTSIIKIYHCDSCQKFHYTATHPSPSGESSGTSRNSKEIKQEFVKLKEAVNE